SSASLTHKFTISVLSPSPHSHGAGPAGRVRPSPGATNTRAPPSLHSHGFYTHDSPRLILGPFSKTVGLPHPATPALVSKAAPARATHALSALKQPPLTVAPGKDPSLSETRRKAGKKPADLSTAREAQPSRAPNDESARGPSSAEVSLETSQPARPPYPPQLNPRADSRTQPFTLSTFPPLNFISKFFNSLKLLVDYAPACIYLNEYHPLWLHSKQTDSKKTGPGAAYRLTPSTASLDRRLSPPRPGNASVPNTSPPLSDWKSRLFPLRH
ncbi:unnamed protein product, partial [Pleuronectes platessa]